MSDEKTYIGDLIFIQGVPNNGKKILGEVILRSLLTDTPDVISLDNYFIDKDGNDKLDNNKLVEYHNDCQQRCSTKMKHEITKIVVSYTLTEKWEEMIKPYYEMAERYNYRIHVIIETINK